MAAIAMTCCPFPLCKQSLQLNHLLYHLRECHRTKQKAMLMMTEMIADKWICFCGMCLYSSMMAYDHLRGTHTKEEMENFQLDQLMGGHDVATR